MRPNVNNDLVVKLLLLSIVKIIGIMANTGSMHWIRLPAVQTANILKIQVYHVHMYL